MAETDRYRDERGREGADAEAPESLEQALTRARHHARRATSEGIQAARALVDAASLAAGGPAASGRPAFSGLLATLDDFGRALEGGAVGSPIFDGLHDALDGEVRRWEARAQVDPDARSVLRAFLGVREILWELGIRRSSTRSTPEGQDTRGATSRRASASRTTASPRPSAPAPSKDGSSPPRAQARRANEAARGARTAPREPEPSRPWSHPQRSGDARPQGRRVQRIEIDP